MTHSVIEKQFSLRRSGSDEPPTVTPEEIEAIKKSRLKAAASTAIKIAGLKVTVRVIQAYLNNY